MKDFGLYIVITNPTLDYQTFCETCVAEKVPMLQLREKTLSDLELKKLSQRLKDITTGSNTKFIINDRPDIASLIKADGLHLGQDDLTCEDARKIISPDMLTGVSTHNLAQALNLINTCLVGCPSGRIDYMSFGPIYPTTAKIKPDQAVGIEYLKQIISISSIPVVAIGGIFPNNIQDVLSSGARNIAMIRHFTLSKDVHELRDKIRTMKTILKENHK